MTTKTIRDLTLTARLLGWALAIAVLAGVAIAGSSEDLVFGPPSDDYSSFGDGHVEKLIEKHDCWTGGEGHPIPTGAVVTYKGETAARYVSNPKKVDEALNHALGSESERIYSVAGFCA